MEITIDMLMENIRITKVETHTSTLHAEGEVIGVDVRFIYEYNLGNKLTGREELCTDDLDHAKELIVIELLNTLDGLDPGTG